MHVQSIRQPFIQCTASPDASIWFALGMRLLAIETHTPVAHLLSCKCLCCWIPEKVLSEPGIGICKIWMNPKTFGSLASVLMWLEGSSGCIRWGGGFAGKPPSPHWVKSTVPKSANKEGQSVLYTVTYLAHVLPQGQGADWPPPHSSHMFWRLA